DGAIQQVDLRIVLAHQHMAELMRESHDANGAHRIDEQRVRAVEAVDVTEPVARIRPPRRLHGAAGFDRHLVKRQLPVVPREASQMRSRSVTFCSAMEKRRSTGLKNSETVMEESIFMFDFCRRGV